MQHGGSILPPVLEAVVVPLNEAPEHVPLPVQRRFVQRRLQLQVPLPDDFFVVADQLSGHLAVTHGGSDVKRCVAVPTFGLEVNRPHLPDETFGEVGLPTSDDDVEQSVFHEVHSAIGITFDQIQEFVVPSMTNVRLHHAEVPLVELVRGFLRLFSALINKIQRGLVPTFRKHGRGQAVGSSHSATG